MKKQTDKQRLIHIQEAILEIKSYTSGISELEFQNDSKTSNAVLYKFVVIGEATKNIDSEILEKYNYPWHIPKSFRNFIAHEYHRINLSRVYKATQNLDELLEIIKEILKKEF